MPKGRKRGELLTLAERKKCGNRFGPTAQLAILDQHLRGKKQVDIAAEFGTTRLTVRRIIKAFQTRSQGTTIGQEVERLRHEQEKKEKQLNKEKAEQCISKNESNA